jgi:flagellar basal body-associated protein FliL
MAENSAARKAALWVAVVFILGLALGGTIGYVFAHQKYTVTSASPTSESARRAQKVQELTQLASLTAEQSQQVEAIIRETQGQIKGIRQTTDPQINEARQKGRERIRAILSAEQKPKFEEFIKKLDEERKRNAQ